MKRWFVISIFNLSRTIAKIDNYEFSEGAFGKKWKYL